MSFPKIFYSKICKTTFSIHSRMWNQECFCVGVCSQKILTHCVLSYNIILQWIRLGHIIDGGTSYIHKGEIIVAAAARYTRYTLFVPFTLASSPTHSLDSFSLFAYRIYWTILKPEVSNNFLYGVTSIIYVIFWSYFCIKV